MEKKKKRVPSKAHETLAKKLAKKHGVNYPPKKGADIVTNNAVYEVDTEEGISDAIRQLRGYQKPVFIVAINEKALRAALEKTKNTTVGVMDNKLMVRKKSTRKKLKKRRKKK